jgi:hypothetical protein
MLLAVLAGMRALVLLLLGACYTGAPANRDVSLAWRGRAQAELISRWGAPAQQQGPVSVWAFQTTQLELPDVQAALHPVAAVAHVNAPGISGTAVAQGTAVDVAWHPGEILRVHHSAAALLDGATVADVQGEALHWGPPNDANIHWGTLLGAHVGMGTASKAGSPLPSGQLYVGGMVTPTVGLVGSYSFVAASGDGGSVIDQAAGVAAQYWPATRIALRGGPAMLLVSDPGVTNFGLKLGASVGASYAAVKVGTLALDVYADVCGGPGVVFGSLGVGVNLN